MLIGTRLTIASVTLCHSALIIILSEHNKGIDSFINYYHIKPVKPDLETLRILKIRGDYEDKEELDG
ncbi:hypothetical protein QY884_02485 [Latilactobacillus sakei]